MMPQTNKKILIENHIRRSRLLSEDRKNVLVNVLKGMTEKQTEVLVAILNDGESAMWNAICDGISVKISTSQNSDGLQELLKRALHNLRTEDECREREKETVNLESILDENE